MPLQSVLRILGRMTSNKILEAGSTETKALSDRIQSETTLKKVEIICIFIIYIQKVGAQCLKTVL